MNDIDSTQCPTCESPEPRLHPATQSEGEVTAICPDPFHERRSGPLQPVQNPHLDSDGDTCRCTAEAASQ